MQSRAYKAISGRAAEFRRFVCLMVLVAFTFQGFLVQTHIHGLLPFAAAAAGTQTVSSSKDSGATQDIDHCLLCQEFMHAGAYLMPAAFAALPPYVTAGVVVRIAVPLVEAASPSHIWTSRAPPRA